jgi:5'-nucleotidase
MAFGELTLKLDPQSGRVLAKSARIVPAWADAGVGRHPDQAVARLTQEALDAVGPRVARVVAHSGVALTRSMSAAGESVLGDLVADAQRTATHADIALMNPGGLRSDLRAGPVTWGDVLTLHPFANRLVTLDMTGTQLLAVLEQQWPTGSNALPRILKTSGLNYSWDPARPAGAHIVDVCDAAYQALDPARHYRVTVNDFLANGGDDFTLFRQFGAGESGPLDREALAQYLQSGVAATSAMPPRIARADRPDSSPCAVH